MARLEEALVAGATRDFKMLLRFFVLWPTVRLCTLNVMFVRLETLVDTVRFFFVEINFVVQFFCGSFVVLLWLWNNSFDIEVFLSVVSFSLIFFTTSSCSKPTFFFQVNAALQTAVNDEKIQVAADEVVGAVAFALMCGGRALCKAGDVGSTEGKDGLTKLLTKIQTVYMNTTRKHQALPDPNASIYPNAPSLRDCDALDSIVACLAETHRTEFANAKLAERSWCVVRLAASTLDEAETMELREWSGAVMDVASWSRIHTKSCTREVRLFGDGGKSPDDFSWGESYRSKTLSKLSVSDRYSLRDGELFVNLCFGYQ
jgi:hypothetical protein